MSTLCSFHASSSLFEPPLGGGMEINMKNRIRIVLLLSFLVIAAVFITNKFVYNEGSKSLQIIYIPKVNDGSDFWSSVIAGAEMAAKENEAKLEVIAPKDETDILRQNELILQAIDKKPDAIVVSPGSYEENIDVLKKVKAAGIKLIYIDSGTRENIQDSIVATDNYEAGRKMGEYVKKSLDASSVIAIVAHVKNSSTAIEREQGFRDAIGNHEAQIAEVAYSNSDAVKAYDETKRLIKKYNIDVLACLNEYSAVGAARAVKELGLNDKITIIGFDNSTEEIQLLEEGVFSAIVVQRAYSMGYLGIETAVSCIKGKSTKTNIDSGSLLITKDTMYDTENQEVLFPFYGD